MRFSIAALTLAGLALAQGFTFTIGNPVASQDYQFKSAAFVFRTEGCADPATAQISATAEGIVKGERRSVDLRVMPGKKPGIYGIARTWPADGQWVVSLKGKCASSTAGAIVSVRPGGVVRESLKLLSRPATESEIETSLRALESGGNK
jgi:hypothetical protein